MYKKSYRIGDKKRSIRIKGFVVQCYAEHFEISEKQALNEIRSMYFQNNGVDSDLLSYYILQRLTINMRALD